MQGLAAWGEYIAAFVIFFVSHRLPLRAPIKAWVATRIGAAGFTMVYSIMSVGVLTWVIIAAGRAPYVELWAQATWMTHVTLSLMGLAVALFVLAIGRPNPLSFGGLNDADFNPQSPGVIGWIKHPLLGVLGLWSLAHIISNGNLAHVLMFGQFAIFSLVGRKIIDARRKRILGDPAWTHLTATTRHIAITANGLARLAIAAALYLGLIWLHMPVIGVDPLAHFGG